MTPEERARQNIDALLTAAGWVVQDRTAQNLNAGQAVAVREFPLKTGEADYLLFVDRKAVGAIEAKKEGVTLTGVEAQSAKYRDALKPPVKAWRDPLPFLYESTGVETQFTNGLDPQPRSRPVFAFHQPATLRKWATEPSTLRARLRHLPPLITAALWPAQVEAITNLERSLADDRPRALIQMATGSGKTFTAINFVYRLIAHGGARQSHLNRVSANTSAYLQLRLRIAGFLAPALALVREWSRTTSEKRARTLRTIGKCRWQREKVRP